MELTVIGVGYVGLVSAAMLANAGHKVYCVEKDVNKLNVLKAGKSYFYEKGLESYLSTSFSKQMISFHDNVEIPLSQSKVILLCLPTPSEKNGIADLSAIYQVASHIAKFIQDGTTIVVKSTVPVGTTRRIYKIIRDGNKNNSRFVIQMNPEFLRQGNAVDDFINPYLTVIGRMDGDNSTILQEIYQPVISDKSEYIYVNLEDAEMTKYASNLFLANRISLINELACLCEKTGADVRQVKEAIGKDPNIGSGYLNAGIGFGGSCFSKDIDALIYMGNLYGLSMPMAHAVKKVNTYQKSVLVQKLIDEYPEGLVGKKIAVWGLTFKPDTSDTREAPSIDIVKSIYFLGGCVYAYDPMQKVFQQADDTFSNIIFCDDPYVALCGADALLILTEWNEFYNIDIDKLVNNMNAPLILDGRDVIILNEVRGKQVRVIKIGKKND